MHGSSIQFRRQLLQWYARHRRELPWRLPRGARKGKKLNPYHVLVSEAMLQQTQVATVIPYFARFIERFPTVQSLAQADGQDVLRLWQGLGYYSRARNLQAAARAIIDNHEGEIPMRAQQLRSLPGVGRYTAGAVASIAFDQPAAIVDGNVARVLARIDCIDRDLAESDVRKRLWTRAEELVQGRHPGDFNSAMMELGATVCTPKAPKCLLCPVATHCEALAAGLQEKLPRPKKRAPQLLLTRDVLCITHAGRWLIEQRPAKGRWASMWQFLTLEARGKSPTASILRDQLGIVVGKPRSIGTVTHALTHRRYRFNVYRCDVKAPNAGNRVWVELDELHQYPLPRPHLKVAEILASLGS